MSSNSIGELASAHDQATLAEHLEMRLRFERHKNPLTGEILQFFELDDCDLTLRSLSYPLFETPNLHRALRQTLRAGNLELERGDAYNWKIVWAPAHKRFQVRPGKFVNLLVDGSLFYRSADGAKRVVVLEENRQSDGLHTIDVTLVAPRADERRLGREIARIARSMRRRHYLAGQAVRADGTLIDRTSRVTWDDVALSPAVRSALETHVLGLLEQRALFCHNGIPQRRGILLYGPPGTGKTMVGKVLAGLGVASLIWATAADFKCIEAARRVFQLARQLKPTILFLEDLDFYAGDRSGGTTVMLGELLSQMDGMDENDGLIVVATTNDLEAIEPAMRDRPSRFDVVLEVGLPAADARRQILSRALSRQAPAGELIERAVAETEGLSGAQLQEVAILAVQQAIFRGDVDAGGIARVAGDDLIAAVEKLSGRRKTPIGFTKA